MVDICGITGRITSVFSLFCASIIQLVLKTNLALIIGNFCLHWGLLSHEGVEFIWDTDYISPGDIHQLLNLPTLEGLLSHIFSSGFPKNFCLPTSLFIASVVPSQTLHWQNNPNVKILTLKQVPLKGIYVTLGIDRALALWGAGNKWKFPILVIDGGTALTYTGADANHTLVGGAILPGLGLQLTSLGEKTGQLPYVIPPESLPQRYGLKTQAAIQSGVIYTLISGVKDFIESWWEDFPQSPVVITGGDRRLLYNYLQIQYPAIAKRLLIDGNLIFMGMKKIIFNNFNS